MILKPYEVSKIDIKKFPLILFYGQNNGAKEEETSKLIKQDKNIKPYIYEEKEILENYEELYNDIVSDSLFDEKKIFIIKRVTDKFLKIIDEILNKNLSNILIILDSGNLEKKSKLRNLFEKDKKLICIPFYPDNFAQLTQITNNFFNKINQPVSQSDINLIVSKSNGDRGNLKNELQKIELYVSNKKKLTSSSLLKLINLVENHNISELVDQYLAKNERKIKMILNENILSNEDSIIIVRTLLNKSKKILKLSSEYEKNKNLDLTISSSKPPIFWKDKEITKQQILKWKPENIKKLIYELSELELLIKKNIINSMNMITNFIFDQSSSKTNN